MFTDNPTYNEITKESLDVCLRKLAREYRRLNGTAVSAELILTGGAAVLTNYVFRDATYDVDAIIHATSSIKDAANRVGDELRLPYGWLNSDFTRTKSYSPKLAEFSQYYRTYSNVLTIRTISGEYLVAMKLMAGRSYKNDISDVVGIFREEKEKGTPLTYEAINKAVYDLYGGWTMFPPESQLLVKEIMETNDLDKLYEHYRATEKETKSELIDFERKYPKILNENNLKDITAQLKKKKNRDMER